MSRSESTDKFCLKWNDFDTNLRHAFQQFREEKDFFDVSLVCEDEQIEAHKMILSASSVFFKNLFKRNSSHKHPFIYLKGVKLQELQSLLQFMYQGEVNVAQDDLQTFLAAAEELRVHGLTQDLNKSTPKANKKESKSKIAKESLTSNSDDVLVPSSSLSIPITNMYDDANDDIAEVNDNEVMAVEDPLSQHGSSNNQYYPEFDDSHSSSIDFSDEGFLFNNLLKEPFNYDNVMTKVFDGSGLHVFECNVCKKIMRRKDHMKNHVQIHMSKEVKCDYCGTTCKNMPSLKVHISQKHRQYHKQFNGSEAPIPALMNVTEPPVLNVNEEPTPALL